jgi:hypothetical protein
VAHGDSHVAHRDAADHSGGAESAAQPVRGDVPAPGGLGDAVHHAPGVKGGQRVIGTVAQQGPRRSAVDDNADRTHDRH